MRQSLDAPGSLLKLAIRLERTGTYCIGRDAAPLATRLSRATRATVDSTNAVKPSKVEDFVSRGLGLVFRRTSIRSRSARDSHLVGTSFRSAGRDDILARGC